VGVGVDADVGFLLRVGVTAATRVFGSGSSSAIALSMPISVQEHPRACACA